MSRRHLAAAILALALAFRLIAGAAHHAAAGSVRAAAAPAPTVAAAGIRAAGTSHAKPEPQPKVQPKPEPQSQPKPQPKPQPTAHPAAVAHPAATAAQAAPAPARLPATDADVAAMLAQAIPNLPSTAAAPTPPDAPPPASLASQIGEAARSTGLPADLIAAVIMAESAGDPTAVSPTGAQGLMQLEPPTASWLGVRDAFDPTQNVMAGASYLASLLRTYMTAHAGCAAQTMPSDSGTGPCPSPLIEALAAYNAGPHVVGRYGGVPPYPETQRYIAQVLANFAAYSAR